MAQIQQRDWYLTVRGITEQLVAVRSVSPGTGERTIAQIIVDLLRAGDLGDAYTLCTLEPLPGDRYGRAYAIAYLRGKRPETMILLGHIDTVGTEDYGALEPLATDPAVLAEHWRELMGNLPLDHPDEWMFGRGALDMKSGVAVNIALMRHFAHQIKVTGEPPPLSLVFAGTPDEETESAGMLALMPWLVQLRQREGLNYVGLINTDYVTPRHAGDPVRPIYMGSVGKLLPIFYVVGKATHVGDPYGGIDANLLSAELVRDLCMDPALTERVGDAATPPPVTLHHSDLKTAYNVQTPLAAWFYLNVLTLSATPAEWLDRLKTRSQAALRRVQRRLARGYRTLYGDLPLPAHLVEHTVLTYAELLAATQAARGADVVRATLDRVRRECPPALDSREATLRLIAALWTLSGRDGPAVVIAYAPPYYPHVGGTEGTLTQAIHAVVAHHPDEHLAVRDYFPLLSDLSYARHDPAQDISALTANMPLWMEQREGSGAGYTIPFNAIREAGIAGVANIGPLGWDGHQRTERVHMPFSFATVPQLIYETIHEVVRLLASGTDGG
jgi:arginine utilization protein RocB